MDDLNENRRNRPFLNGKLENWLSYYKMRTESGYNLDRDTLSVSRKEVAIHDSVLRFKNSQELD